MLGIEAPLIEALQNLAPVIDCALGFFPCYFLFGCNRDSTSAVSGNSLLTHLYFYSGALAAMHWSRDSDATERALHAAVASTCILSGPHAYSRVSYEHTHDGLRAKLELKNCAITKEVPSDTQHCQSTIRTFKTVKKENRTTREPKAPAALHTL